jgi:hypothetical protein
MGTMMNPEQVCEARRLAWDGKSARQIAARLGLAYPRVYSAITGRSWRSVTEPPPLPVGMLTQRMQRMPTRKKLPPYQATGKHPCRYCEVLTSNPSGYCDFCHSEGRAG